jgi:large subunit ribosomal protein L1
MAKENHRGKKYVASATGLNRDELHDLTAAVTKVKSMAKAKFDETVDIAVRLGLDTKKSEQTIRGTVSMPSGTGTSVRDLAADIEKGNMNFDIAIATPDLMPLVGKLGRALGPRGLMPNPKTGTVTTDVARAVSEFKGGKVEYRTDRYGNVHVPVGKASFEVAALVANVKAVLDELQRSKPAAAKGRYMKRITVSSTMSPGVRIDPSVVEAN